MSAKGSRSKTETPPAPRLARYVRVGVSLLLIAHLTVVIATPMVVVPPRSLLASRITAFAAPYLQAGNISHGYAFFAPDPGPSHLVRFEMEFSDGRVEKGVFPNLKEQWPRLRYHRHFMLTEQLAGSFVESQPPPKFGDTPEALAEWEEAVRYWKIDRSFFMERARSYAQHLLVAHGAQTVRLTLIRHEMPTPAAFLAGRRLDDPTSYVTVDVDPFVTVTDTGTGKEQP